MSKKAIKKPDNTPTNAPIKQIIVPAQEPKPVKDAYATASSLHGELAGFIDVIMNKVELRQAKLEGYSFAVAPKGLPLVRGWYQVCRETASLKPISEEEAESLRKAELWDEVFYLYHHDALKAAKEGRPVMLGVGYDGRIGRFLDVIDWPEDLARVAIIKPEAAGMLRSED